MTEPTKHIVMLRLMQPMVVYRRTFTAHIDVIKHVIMYGACLPPTHYFKNGRTYMLQPFLCVYSCIHLLGNNQTINVSSNDFCIGI